ncbi:MAG: hypothetical protein NTV94_03350 [Planctomycetota bacterium]|nr:hypothetical protein [Planctomycetota bacterium]
MHTHATSPSVDTAQLRHAICSRLRQFESLAASLTTGQYTAPHGPGFFGATIGAHVRHCLDHVRALVDGVHTGRVEYDHRERGTPIESSPTHACAHAITLIEQLKLHNTLPAQHPLELIILASHDEPAATVSSTFARELAFVLSHTIHHQAMIHAMLAVNAHAPDQRLPDSFGLAPSTIAHQHTSSCAR